MALQQSPSNRQGASFWALLVGIEQYQVPNLSTLRGCVNDVDAMRGFLLDQLGVPADHVMLLLNEQATRSSILETFENFLINNPAIAPGDQILFHYSGHGSQMPDLSGTEPEGYDETIVPYDGRTSGVYDIPDKTLAALLARLAERKGHNITVILDSCHSGSATRGMEVPSLAAVRQVGADNRTPPPNLDASIRSGYAPSATGASGWAMSRVPYVLFAGCRDREESNEYAARPALPEAGDTGTGTPVWHGAFTYFLLQAMRTASPDTTYADLHERVSAQVNAIYPGQMPQCEGDRSRVLFGGRSIERDNFITVRHVSADAVSLGSGLVHGLRPGTEVALYPADIKSREDLASRPMATAVVTSVQATTAQASLLQPLTSPLTAGVRALITRQVYEGIRQTVALHQEGAPDGLVLDRIREAICHSTPDGGPSPYLSLVDSPHQTVDLHVKLEDGVARILNANGELLLLPEQLSTMGPDAGVKIRQALESVARYRSLQQLTNREAGSQIVGKVKLGLRRYLAQATGYTAEELPAQAYGSGGELTIQYDAEHPDRNLYSVTVANLSPLPIYPHIFILGPDFSIQRLYPRLGQQEFVPPGHTVSAGLDSPQEVLEMYLPEGWNASRDYVKLIATTTPTDLGSLEQTALSVPAAVGGRSRGAMQPLDQLLEAVAFGGGTRHARPNRTATTEDWATAELPLTTVRSEQITQLDLPAARVDLGDGITLVKPEGFQGQVRVTTQGNVARGMGDRGPARVPPPPGLARFPGIFQPVARIGTRGIGPTELLVEFELDEESRRSVSEDRPLRLELPSPAGDGYSELVPVMFDGEDYLLVGYGTEEGSGVDLVSLPAPVAAPENEISTRSITGTLRLFLYKKAGKNSTELGLRRPRLSGEDLTYEEVTPDQFQQGQKVAILIHGFTSNTQGIAKIFPHFAEEYGLTYDHVLTWDYETFGTGVHDNGKLLATALKQRCGLHPDDDITIHIFAHSMGSLVSRCLIELEGGHEIIDRLIMAGPPNQGSPMASMTRGVVFFFTTLINFAGVIPPIGVANWALKSLFEQGVGLSDISLKSPISQELNTLAEPNNVPYLVLAGTNPLSEEANARMERLAHKMMGESLEKIFRETNDRWVGISSLQGVRNGSYPQLTVELVPCDHNHYYVTPEGRQSMKQWLDQ